MSDSAELKPYISREDAPPEFTVRSLLLATVVTLLFGVASGYLGLKIGMTFAASIPAAVIALAVLRGLFRSSNILESNMVQTQASAGESLMGGVVYMIPALIFLNLDPSILQISVMSLAGGLLGVFMLIPFRHHLIVQQHGTLPYPEGTACANILKLGEKAGSEARHVLSGMGLGAIYNVLSADGLKLFSAQIKLSFQQLWGLTVGFHLTPLMLGVGFLCGSTVGFTMLGGALMKGILILPGLTWGYSYFYQETLSSDQIDFYVRMIGAGAVSTGGFLSIMKMLPQMVVSLRGAAKEAGHQDALAQTKRVSRNIPGPGVAIGILAALVLSVVAMQLSVPEGGSLGIGTILLSLVLITVLGVLFVTLCARLVGLVGTSSYPLSGQTIGALLVSVSILRFTGHSGELGMTVAIVIGAVICISIATSADISQDLKTGALLGATPYRQQIGEVIGVLLTSLVAGLVIMLFHESGELARLPAPQARLMAAIVQGVMTDDFQWYFAGVGVLIAIAAELLGVSAIMLAVGLYLPIPLASAFVLGGVVRGLFDRQDRPAEETELLERKGTLLASGMIAGWAIMGVLLVGVVALREFDVADIDPALRSLPEQGWSLGYLADFAVSLLLFVGVFYYFGRLLRLWGK